MIHDEETDHLECNTNTAVGVLEYGKYFHLYNQGVQGCVLFRDHSEYEKFMKEYERNVDGVYRSRKP